MEQIRLSFISAAFMLLACACVQMTEDLPETAGMQIITATLESGPDTRTVLSKPDANGIYYPYWSAGDDIAVYVDGINAPDKYVLSEGAGTARASFSGRLSGLSMLGLYPYSCKTDEGLSDGILTIELPAIQEYVEGTFASGAYPMMALGEGTALSFKNLCSVLKLSMTGDDIVQSIKFSAHDSWMPVCGKGTIDLASAAAPELVMGEGDNEITLECEYVRLDPSKPTDFFLVVPPGTYRGGFTVEIKTFKGTVTKNTEDDITFLRSQFRSIPPFECNAGGEYSPDNLPYDQIWYETSNSWYLELDANWFDRSIVSHTYADGKGVIIFDGPVTTLKNSAFWYRREMTALHLPNCVTTLDSYTCYGCGLSSFRTPDNLQTIGSYCFQDNPNLSWFEGKWASEDGRLIITQDGNLGAYANAMAEPELVIPEGVKSIAAGVFRYNQIIRDVILPEGLERIYSNCFWNCPALETVYFPSSIQSVEYGAFSYCNNLREFKGESELLPDSRSIVQNHQLVAFAGAGIANYSVPGNVRNIASSVFCGWQNLRSITFENALDWVNSPLINGCDNLEFFYGPGTTDDHHALVTGGHSLAAVTPVCPADYVVQKDAGIQTIEYSAFGNNSSIERLVIPDEVSSIGYYAFENMQNLKTLVLPAKLENCSGYVFRSDNALEAIYLRSYSPPRYQEDDWSFAGHEGLTVYVPFGMESSYMTASGWNRYAPYIKGYVYTDLPSPDFYVSTDYSNDGKVTRLQTASEGAGIELVFMGDAFSDRQIADGTYDAVIQKMADAFFSEEPYTTLRPLFNVSSVAVVSVTEGYDRGGQALGGWFGGGTQVGGDDQRCIDYALQAVPEEKMNSTIIIVAMNQKSYAGTCYMYYPSEGDYGDGLSIAYFPLGTNDEMLAQLVHHEAGGHGFSKLGDEYAYEYMGRISQDNINDMNENTIPFGWWKNCDFTSDPEKVKWSRFLSDERYKYDGLGCFEGGLTYWSGVWRPTYNSIMNDNTGGFNAPSRESIWYRAHKLAYGSNWQYDYEEFVSYDAKNRKTSAGSVQATAPRAGFVPTHPPVVVKHGWNEQ